MPERNVLFRRAVVVCSNFTKLKAVFFLFALIVFANDINGQDQPDPRPRNRSQIIDDSTKQVYGPRTSRYFKEKDFFYNRFRYTPIDTAIRNFHRFDYVQRHRNLYQDLGVLGTAIQPIFYQAPSVIGRRAGAHVYDLYWEDEPVLYYDTKSPYTNMKVIIGGLGRSITRAAFSRNINPRWNFGFTYRGVLVDKQLERTGKGDRVARNNYYDAYTSYKSKDSTYRLFLNFRRSFHRVSEYGGVQFPEGDTVRNYFSENAVRWLNSAESNDLRINYHLFHEYRIGKALQVYHTADRYRQKNNFLDYLRNEPTNFFDTLMIPYDSVRDVVKLNTFRNEVGIKGNLSKLFYNGYYAIKSYRYRSNRFGPDTLNSITYDSLHVPTKGIENYLGGRIALSLDSIGEVSGWAEVMYDQGTKSLSNYRIQGEIISKWFEARISQMRYKPGYVQQAYRGAFDVWNNNFQDIESSQLNGYLHYRSSVLSLSPGLTFTRLRNYVFFKKISNAEDTQQVLPLQSDGNQIIASPEARVALTFFRHITLSTQAIYTRMLENADDAISVPELIVNSQLSYANIFYGGNLDMHAGVDVHWKSDYHAMGYDPAIRQFYIQNEFLSPSFPVIDIFVNAKIKRGRLFFKYHNLVQAITKQGYFPTPGYPGQRNVFDFGFDWSFYD